MRPPRLPLMAGHVLKTVLLDTVSRSDASALVPPRAPPSPARLLPPPGARRRRVHRPGVHHRVPPASEGQDARVEVLGGLQVRLGKSAPEKKRSALPPSARNSRTAQTFLRLGLHPAAPSRCAPSAFVGPMPSFRSTHSPTFTCTLFQFRPTLSRAPRPIYDHYPLLLHCPHTSGVHKYHAVH